MKGISPKPVDKESVVDALNKEIIPLLREMRKFFGDAGVFALTFIPDHYTRSVVLPARRTWQLVAHLKGIDSQLGALRAELNLLRARVDLLDPP